MAKGLRSKSRRAARTAFRETFGQEDKEKKAAIVQSKLQECISKGGMNSIDKIAAQFGTNNMETEDVNDDNSAPDIDAVELTDYSNLGKNPKKIPKKRSVKSKITYEINANKPSGQSGSHLEIKKRMKGTRKVRPPQPGKKRTSAKKRRFEVSF